MPVSFGKIRNVRDLHGSDVVTATRLLRRNLRHHVPQGEFTTEVADVEPLRARINHGRWIVDCPVPECGGAELVDPDNPRFWCLSCDNHGMDGRWYPVEFPAERPAIETVLLKRPNAANQNWRPGETVDDLRRENERYGVVSHELDESRDENNR